MELKSPAETVSRPKEKINSKKKINRIVYECHLLLTVYGCWDTNDWSTPAGSPGWHCVTLKMQRHPVTPGFIVNCWCSPVQQSIRPTDLSVFCHKSLKTGREYSCHFTRRKAVISQTINKWIIVWKKKSLKHVSLITPNSSSSIPVRLRKMISDGGLISF